MENRFTGTGLDRLVETIESDTGVQRRVSDADLHTGAQAAGELNHLLLEGIEALGLANDGSFDRSDLRGLSDWIRGDAGRNATYLDLYGRNNGGSETGFQLVQNEDSNNRLFGEDAIDEVADAIYSIGFGYDGQGRSLDVNGDAYRSLNLTASWMNDLLSDADMEALSNSSGSLVVEGTTGTGLDRVIEILQSDPGLVRNVSQTDIASASRAVDGLNHLYLEGMSALGLANDGTIDKADVIALDEWVGADQARFAEFDELHSDWLRVVNRGAEIGQVDGFHDGIHPHIGHVVNHGFLGMYTIGFGSDDGMLFEQDGTPKVSASVGGHWFNQLLSDSEKQALDNPDGALVLDPSTGTGLDQLVEIIDRDAGLARNVSGSDIAEAARAADGMNDIITDAIGTLGLADDGAITGRDVEQISDHIRGNDALHEEFMRLYGSSNAAETGFQMVQDNGGVEKLFGKWAVNHVADAVYHVGFETEQNMFVDGNGNVSYSVKRVAEWIDDLYFADAPAGNSGGAKDTPEDGPAGLEIPAASETATGLDRLVDIINSDAGLARNVSQSAITEGANAAAAMNEILVDVIGTLGVADDGRITDRDVEKINTHIRSDADLQDEFEFLYGAQTDAGETGFEAVNGNGGEEQLFGKWAVNNVADAVYHAAFEIEQNMFLDIDGDVSYSVKRVAEWIDDLYFA